MWDYSKIFCKFSSLIKWLFVFGYKRILKLLGILWYSDINLEFNIMIIRIGYICFVFISIFLNEEFLEI